MNNAKKNFEKFDQEPSVICPYMGMGSQRELKISTWPFLVKSIAYRYSKESFFHAENDAF